MRWSFPIRSGQQNIFELRLLQTSFQVSWISCVSCLLWWNEQCTHKKPCLFGFDHTISVSYDPVQMALLEFMNKPAWWDVVELFYAFFIAQVGTLKSENNSMQTVLIVENFRIRCMAIKDPSKLLWPAAKKCQCTTVGLLCLYFTQMFARQLRRVELFCTRQFSRDSVARNIVKSLSHPWAVSPN